jgi:succinyl-diaminopimelate desuccinylase
MELFKRIDKRLEALKEEMIELQIKLTAIPALSPKNQGQGEAPKAKCLLSYLQRYRFPDIKEINAPDPRVPEGYRPNIIARIPGKTKETVWIMTHLDIVPPGDLSTWKSDPYKVKIEGNRLYGRGCEDNQQALVSSLFAARVLMEENIVPIRNVALLFVADEETGSEFGIQYLLKKEPPFKKEDIIVVPDGGVPDGSMIQIAEKELLWTKFTVLGKQCHGSIPQEGINASRVSAYLIVKLDRLYKKFDKENSLFDPPQSTFEPTKREANVPNINTIPGKDVFYMDARILPDYSVEEIDQEIVNICREIEEEFNVKIKREYVYRSGSTPYTSPSSKVVAMLKEAIRDVYKVEPKVKGIGGGTVAAFIRREGFDVGVWSRVDSTMHAPNEYCVVDNMIGDAKVFARLFIQE